MSRELANLFAKQLIARTDRKAIQKLDGTFIPVEKPWTRENLDDHLARVRTYGHYLLSPENKCKMFAFDIGLVHHSSQYPWPYDHTAWSDDDQFLGELKQFYPHVHWTRDGDAKLWLELQMKTLAARLCHGMRKELQIPCAVTYTGSEGLHVYGLIGQALPASDVRAGAEIVMESVLGGWVPHSWDKNLFYNPTRDPLDGTTNFTVRVFPKDDETFEDEKPSLLRLPLGQNLKTKQRSYFVDMAAPLTHISFVDPVWALTTDNPFKKQGE